MTHFHSLAMMRIVCGVLLAAFVCTQDATPLYHYGLACLATLFSFGLATRLVGPLLTGLYFVFWLSLDLAVTHHSFLLVPMLCVVGLGPSAQAYSLDHWWWRVGQSEAAASLQWVYTARLLVPISYAFTFAAHTSGALAQFHILAPMALVFTLLSLGVWWHRSRKLTLMVAAAFHLYQYFTLPIDAGLYTLIMLCNYLAFLNPTAGQTLVLYDGSCRFCERSRRATMGLDWLRRLSWLNFRNPMLMAQVRCVSSEQLEQEMVTITSDGKPHAGFYAWRAILLRLPLTCLPATLLYVPGLTQLGSWLYAWIARNRFGIAPCNGEACRIAQSEEELWRHTLARANAHASSESAS